MYLLTFEVEKYDFVNNRPKTAVYEEARAESIPLPHMYLCEKLEKWHFLGLEQVRYSHGDIFKKFNDWAAAGKYKYEPTLRVFNSVIRVADIVKDIKLMEDCKGGVKEARGFEINVKCGLEKMIDKGYIRNHDSKFGEGKGVGKFDGKGVEKIDGKGDGKGVGKGVEKIDGKGVGERTREECWEKFYEVFRLDLQSRKNPVGIQSCSII